ncbi:hypothetical protein niasHS_016074 [Heterodera schachtii]|uniref:Transmembrane protein n=1 Tax=Heterodera schachtii TaxID=97005 RepID=A0ABD2HYD5_HETSC
MLALCRFLFPLNFCFLFLIIFPIVNTDHQQSLWSGFYQSFALELPQEERSDDTLALFAEMDEVDTVLTDGIGAAIMAPPSPAHPAFQKFYLDKKSAKMSDYRTDDNAGKSDGQNAKSESSGDVKKHKKKPWQRLRSLFARARLLKRTARVVQAYQRLKDVPGGWGELVRKMYAEMIVAKRMGAGDAKLLRENSQRALQLLQQGESGAEGQAVLGGGQRFDVAHIEPFRDFWSLVKSSAQTLLALFKGPFHGTENAADGGKSGGGKSCGERQMATTTEQFVRVLKTFAAEENEEGTIFTRSIVRKGGETEGKLKRQQRRRKRLDPFLAFFGMVILVFCVLAILIEICRS